MFRTMWNSWIPTFKATFRGTCAQHSDRSGHVKAFQALRGKEKSHTPNHYVSLYLYYIIKFNVVPETNHTGWTDITARPQHTVPAKREKRQRKAQRVLKLRKGHRTWWSGEEKVQTDEYMSKEKTGGNDWVGYVKHKETGKLLTERWMKTERHGCREMTRDDRHRKAQVEK